jgi:hypothetical protein
MRYSLKKVRLTLEEVLVSYSEGDRIILDQDEFERFFINLPPRNSRLLASFFIKILLSNLLSPYRSLFKSLRTLSAKAGGAKELIFY